MFEDQVIRNIKGIISTKAGVSAVMLRDNTPCASMIRQIAAEIHRYEKIQAEIEDAELVGGTD